MHISVAAAVGDVDPIVECPVERVCPQLLRTPRTKAGPLDSTHIRAAISVGVFQIEKVWRVCNQHTGFVWHHTRGEIHTVAESDNVLIATIAVLIFKPPNSASAFGDRI